MVLHISSGKKDVQKRDTRPGVVVGGQRNTARSSVAHRAMYTERLCAVQDSGLGSLGLRDSMNVLSDSLERMLMLEPLFVVILTGFKPVEMTIKPLNKSADIASTKSGHVAQGH